MSEQDRLINAVIDLAHELKGMRSDMNQQLGDLNKQLGDLNKRVASLEKQQAITNLELREIRQSYINIDKHLNETYKNHEKRITKLEHLMLK